MNTQKAIREQDHLNISLNDLPEEIRRLKAVFHKHGFKLYLVGGGSRILITAPKKKVDNWDFTTDATPEQILKLFPKRSFYENRFGTVTIVGKKKIPYEITTFRSEKGYSDQRHPDKVFWGKTIEEDLSRRDFTINAIAIDLSSGKIIDPFKGQNDLRAKIIRAVGNPEQRFKEDALRMIRAIRIASQLGFIIEEKTFAAIKKNAPLLEKISAERIRDEMIKILATRYAREGFLLLLNSDLLKLIIPELITGYGLKQAKHHIYDVWNHSLNSLKYCPAKDPVVRLATLLHDVGKPATAEGKGEERTFHNHEVVGARMAKAIAKRLRFSKKDIDRIYLLVRRHQFTVDERQTDKAVRRFIKNVGKENLQDILNLRIGDRLGGGARRTSWRLELFKKRLLEVQKQPFSLKDLKVNGKDVMKILNIPPSKKVGEILNKLFREVEKDKNKNEREYLLKKIKFFS